MVQDLVVTGFGAFPGVKQNPSARLARSVGENRCWSRSHRSVAGAILPVGYAEVERRLAEMATAPPRVLLIFGVAARRTRLTPERRAINRVSRILPDAMRSQPGRGLLEAGGPAFRWSRAVVAALVVRAREAGCAASMSYSAGRYVCNAALWHGLRLMPTTTAVAFIHIPMPLKPGTRKIRPGGARGGRPQPSVEALEHAGLVIARAMLARARRNPSRP